MNRSVVLHHNTAWWRSQLATSRCPSGSARRPRSGRGGTRVAWATPLRMLVALSKLKPDQKTHGQHHCHRMAGKARPQPTLILLPTPRPCGFFMVLLNGMATMGISNQVLPRRRGRQIAPRELGLLGLAASRPLSPQPADVGLTFCCQTPSPQCHTWLASPAWGAMPPSHGAPLAPRHGSPCLLGPLTGWHTASLYIRSPWPSVASASIFATR
jgi:hypothetical protein